MEVKDKTLSNIRENWKFFVLIFLIGMAYAEQKGRDKDFTNLSNRVDKKIQLLNHLEKEVKQLEKDAAITMEKETLVLYRIDKLENNN